MIEESAGDIWSKPEEALKPSKEQLISVFLECVAEERLVACWAYESLRVAMTCTAGVTSYSSILFRSVQPELERYLFLLQECVRNAVEQLRIAHYEYDTRAETDPVPECRQNIEQELGIKASLVYSTDKLDWELRAHEYALQRVETFLLRFTGGEQELVPEFPNESLRKLLQETRRELGECMARTEALWEQEVDRAHGAKPAKDDTPQTK